MNPDEREAMNTDPQTDPVYTIRRNDRGDLIIKWGENQWARYNFAGFHGAPNASQATPYWNGICYPVAADQWAVVYAPEMQPA
jgi:hypothetical protein